MVLEIFSQADISHLSAIPVLHRDRCDRPTPAVGHGGRLFDAASPMLCVHLLLVALVSIVFARGYDFSGFISTFCFGSITAIPAQWPRFARNFSMAWPLAPIVALLCSVPLVKAAGLNIIPWDWNGMHGALWATVVLACVRGVSLLSWPASRPLRYMGAISFSIYLTHPWVISLATHFGLSGTFWAGSVVVMLVVLFAALTFRMVERPGILLGGRIENRAFPNPALGPSPIRAR